MSELTDFLLARIAEDEAAVIDRGECRCDGEFDASQRPDCADRIAIECEAKRLLIKRVGNPAWAGFKIMALPYADHPDYRDEWRP